MSTANPYLEELFRDREAVHPVSARVIEGLDSISRVLVHTASELSSALVAELGGHFQVPVPRSEFESGIRGILVRTMVVVAEQQFESWGIDASESTILGRALAFRAGGDALAVDLSRAAGGVRLSPDLAGYISDELSVEFNPEDVEAVCSHCTAEFLGYLRTMALPPQALDDSVPGEEWSAAISTNDAALEHPAGSTTGPADESLAEAQVPHPGFGVRLEALLLDSSVVAALIVLAAKILSWTGSRWADSAKASWLVICGLPPLYMVVALWWQQTTLGKYALGLSVSSGRGMRKNPGLLPILLRETIGRASSLVFCGAGYWPCFNRSDPRSWADRLAKTSVIRRTSHPVIRRAVVAFLMLVVSLDVGYGLFTALQRYRDRQATAWYEAMKQAGLSTEAHERKITKMRSSPSGSPGDRLKENATQQLAELDALEIEVNRIVAAVSVARGREYLTGVPPSTLEQSERLWKLKLKQIEICRSQARYTLGFASGREDPDVYEERMWFLDSDVEAIGNKIERISKEMGSR